MNASSTASPEPFVKARPASTVLLLRDSAAGFDVFMMVRHREIEFASGALVFPGGSVDDGDRAIVATSEHHTGTNGLDADAIAFRIAGIRETFEESGILLARRRKATDIIDAAAAKIVADTSREALCTGKISFAQIVIDNDLVLALDQLVPYAHWITPTPLKKRFDTWFFIAQAPPEQIGAHDGRESTDAVWLSPREAIEGGADGRFTLPFPTTRNLIRLGKQPSVGAALDHARAMTIVSVMPEMSKDGDKRFLRIPREAGYDGELFEFSGV